MADAVSVFPPGFRLTDSTTGAAMSGAVIRFYDAGTTTPKTVYADAELSTSVGTSVTTDSLGYPTSDGGSTKSLIYVGIASYKLTMEDSGGNVFATHDNIKGAVDVISPDELTVVSTRPVLAKSTNYTVLTTDQSAVISVDCSSADCTMTLPSAVGAGNGWVVTIQHAGTANQVLIATVSSQTLASGATSYSVIMALSRSGEEVSLVSDGSNWRIFAHTPPHIKNAQGIITVTDRLSSPPGSEVEGSIYLLTSSPSGDWSSFLEHDLVQYTSSAWVRFTPIEGWQAWVSDEDVTYRYTGSTWVSNIASDTQAGIIEYAVQSEMEAASSTTLAVTPGRQQFHPGMPKFWVYVTNGTGTPTNSASYNVTSISDDGAGELSVTIATDFTDANYAVLCTVGSLAGSARIGMIDAIQTQTAGVCYLAAESVSDNRGDPTTWHICGLGDQA